MYKTKTMNEYPEWALYVAKDEDGRCWAYEVEPLQFHKGWYENEVGRNKKVSCPIELKNKEWKNALIAVKNIKKLD